MKLINLQIWLDRKFNRTLFWLWVARHVPCDLTYACAITVCAHSTTGKYENTVVPELTMMEANKRYYDDKKYDGKINI